MIFVSWSGFGLLVPVIAILAMFAGGSLGFLPQPGREFVAYLLTAVSLLGMGLFLRKRQARRNLYWIPMEYWSVVGLGLAIMQLPKIFGVA